MSVFSLNIVTPDKCQFQGQAQKIILRTVTGDVCILSNHIDYAASLGTGVAVITDESGLVRKAACSGGIVTVSDNRVSVLPLTFEWSDEIDLERARQAKERAESNIGSIDKSDESYLITEAKLKRALARIQASS